MERFYMSAYTYGAIVYEIECRWGEIRNELDRMAEECGDYSKNYYTEFELWQKPTSELEEWLDENSGTGFEEDEIYYEKAMDMHIHDCYEIYYSICGGKQFLIDNCFYTIAPGEFYCISGLRRVG